MSLKTIPVADENVAMQTVKASQLKQQKKDQFKAFNKLKQI